jgi:hypothetical protein
LSDKLALGVPQKAEGGGCPHQALNMKTPAEAYALAV